MSATSQFFLGMSQSILASMLAMTFEIHVRSREQIQIYCRFNRKVTRSLDVLHGQYLCIITYRREPEVQYNVSWRRHLQTCANENGFFKLGATGATLERGQRWLLCATTPFNLVENKYLAAREAEKEYWQRMVGCQCCFS